jgi:hypothetical protein
VAIDHRLLHRMQRAAGQPAQVLDGEHGLAVERGHELDAGVQREQAQSARRICVQFADHHGARTAVALGAAFLAAHQPARLAQPGQQVARRRDVADVDRLAVQQQADAILRVHASFVYRPRQGFWPGRLNRSEKQRRCHAMRI